MAGKNIQQEHRSRTKKDPEFVRYLIHINQAILKLPCILYRQPKQPVDVARMIKMDIAMRARACGQQTPDFFFARTFPSVLYSVHYKLDVEYKTGQRRKKLCYCKT
jgi:hypothetical protein